MPAALTTSPWQDAVDRFSTKTVVGSKLRSSDWASVPLALRERAFFSAGVENARILSAMRSRVVDGLTQVRTDGILQNKARFVADMRILLGAEPGDSGSLSDITSRRRLELIWYFQNADAHAFAAHKAGMDPDVMDAFPALRLVRVESRRVPRQWFELWGVAGGKVGWVGASQRVMVALRTSPIWVALSRFGRPWPPFDWGSGMGVEDVDRDETEALGLLPKGQSPAERQQQLRSDAAAAAQDWNDGLQASIKGLSPEARTWLKSAFGDQIAIDGDTVEWNSSSAQRPASNVQLPTTSPSKQPAVVSPAIQPAAPVSRALTNGIRGELGSHVDTATAAIDRVHDDGQLPAIPINQRRSGSALGSFEWSSKTGAPVAISIKHDLESWPGLTTAHEIGHFIDHQVLGTRGMFASVANDTLADFRAVVAQTDAVKQMREIMPDWAYFLDPRELWARAYAQYIATKSGDRTLLAQLDRVRAGRQSWRQWTDEDFKPVMAAIDALFQKKGWLK